MEELLKDATSFTRGAHGLEQMAVDYQIMIWMHFIGHKGTNVDQHRTDLHTCSGLYDQACERVTVTFNYIPNYIGLIGLMGVKRKEIAK